MSNNYTDRIWHDGPAFCLDVSAADLIATGGWDGRIIIWAGQGFQQKLSVQAHEPGYMSGVSCVKFALKGKILVSSGADKALIVWNSENLVRVTELIKPNESVSEIFILETSGNILAAGSYTSKILLYDLNTFSIILNHQVNQSPCPISTISINISERLIVTRSEKSFFSIIQYDNEHVKEFINRSFTCMLAVKYSSEILCVDTLKMKIAFRSISKISNYITTNSNLDPDICGEIAKNKQFLITTDCRNQIRKWNLSNMKLEKNEIMDNCVMCLKIFRSCNKIATLGSQVPINPYNADISEWNLCIWDALTLKIIQNFRTRLYFNREIHKIRMKVSKNEEFIILSGLLYNVCIYNCRSNEIQSLIGHMYPINKGIGCYLYYRDLIISGGVLGDMKLWKRDPFGLLVRSDAIAKEDCYNKIINCMCMIDNDNLIAVGGNSNKIHIFKLEDLELKCALIGNKDWVDSLIYMSQRSRLISGSKDRTIMIWNLKQESCEFCYQINNSLRALYTIPHVDNIYAVLTYTGAIYFYLLTTHKKVAEVKTRNSKSLSIEQSKCKKYLLIFGIDLLVFKYKELMKGNLDRN